MSKHINWVPEWAEYFTIVPGFSGPRVIEIQFYRKDEPIPAPFAAYPIEDLPHMLAVRDVQQQMRDKPLKDRMSGSTVRTGLPEEAIAALEDVRQKIRDKPLSDRVKAAPDMVNSPPHYQLLPGVEVYDVRAALLEKVKDASHGAVDDWSRAWEYLTRMWQKNRLEDAQKARWYLDKLIEKLEGGL